MVIKIIEKLSDNIICNWKITNKQEIKENYNIISIVFFFKKDMYKDKLIYIDGLYNIINNIIPNFILRIYHDNTVVDIINDLLKKCSSDHIELYQYDIPIFRDTDIFYHKGTIGTILRFLPLYDNKLHKVNKCIIIDIDDVNEIKTDKNYNKLLKIYENNNVNFSYRSRYCYGILNRISCLLDTNLLDTNIIKYSIIASYIYQSFSAPYYLLSNFLEDLYINQNDKLKEQIIKKCKINNIYEYGIDEFYLNGIHLKYLYKNKMIIAPIIIHYNDIFQGLALYIANLRDDNDILLYTNFLIDLGDQIDITLDKQDIIYILNKYKNSNINDMKIKNELRHTNLFKSLNKIKLIKDYNKLKQFIINKMKENIKLPYFYILLECILNNFNINLNKIKIYILNTDYKNKGIITKSKLKILPY